MSKAMIEPGTPLAKAWAVCLDTETNRCEVSLWLVVSPDVEAIADEIARESSDGRDVAALVSGLTAKLAAFGVAPLLADVNLALQVKG